MREHRTTYACEMTTMHCGGMIARLYEPETKEQLGEIIAGLEDFIVIGGGSNMIFPDGTTDTPVIHLGKGFGTIGHDRDTVFAGASASTAGVLGYCARNSLTGLEFLSGIPGTIGGALWMNAGTKDTGIMDALEAAEFMDREGVHTTGKGQISYEYRRGGFPSRAVITGARLKVKRSTPEEVRSRMESYLQKRRGQPGGYSSGSMFRNPPDRAAGFLIEKAGLKGFRIGGARISEIHANFIINDGNASTSDVKSLMGLIKQRVKEQFGIDLQEEVRIVD
jgi:UDP-N-acetylmuramate dehydrogenase